MHAIPILGLHLSAVLFAASVTVDKDMNNLKEWMHLTAGSGSASDVEEPEVI